jgi:hypothetical protein
MVALYPTILKTKAKLTRTPSPGGKNKQKRKLKNLYRRKNFLEKC